MEFIQRYQKTLFFQEFIDSTVKNSQNLTSTVRSGVLHITMSKKIMIFGPAIATVIEGKQVLQELLV